MKGHRKSILGAGTTLVRQSKTVQPPRHAVVGKASMYVIRAPVAPHVPYEPPPEWRTGPGDPNIKRKWLMHIEDERAGDWKLDR